MIKIGDFVYPIGKDLDERVGYDKLLEITEIDIDGSIVYLGFRGVPGYQGALNTANHGFRQFSRTRLGPSLERRDFASNFIGRVIRD